METAAIVTTAASPDIAALHDRMPVIVPPEAFDLWLDCARVDALTAAALLAPPGPGVLEAYEVSPAVSRTANEGPELIEPIAERPAEASDAAAPTETKPRSRKDDRQASLF
jgi:putative SOS response-associated peptidase YedK